MEQLKSVIRAIENKRPLKEILTMLKAGSDPNEVDKWGYTPLLKELEKGSPNNELIKLLLDNGADPNKTGEEGWTPLMTVIYYDSTMGVAEVAGMLLEKGSLPNIQNEDGNTALHFAVEHNGSKIVAMILDKGADITIKNKVGEMAIDIAGKNSVFVKTKTYVRLKELMGKL